MGNYIIGSYTARIDKGGRIKIPEKFRAAIEEEYGREVFITSLADRSVQIYPLPVWQNLAGISKKGLLQLKPELRMFMLHVNRKGTHYEIDSKGRILIGQALKDKAQLDTEVEVVGLNDHLEIWSKDILEETLDQNPLTDQDFERISDLKTGGDPE